MKYRKYLELIKAESSDTIMNFASMADIELTAADGEKKRPTFKCLAYSGGELNISYSSYPVYIDLAGFKATQTVTILFNHDRDLLVGQGVAEIDNKKVVVSGDITGDVEEKTDPAYKIVSHSKNGFQWPVSVGAEPDEVEFIAEKEKTNVNGKSVKGPAVIVRSATLREVSFVTIGGDKKAFAKIAASAVKEKGMITFEMYVKACGRNVDELSEEEKLSLQAAYDGLKAAGVLEATYNKMVDKEEPAKKPVQAAAPAPVQPEPAQAPVQASFDGVSELKKEAVRIAKLQASLKDHPDLYAKAIEENWTHEYAEVQAELATLRAARPTGVPGFMVSGGNSVELNAEIATAALCMKENVGTRDAGKSLVSSYGQETIDKAEKLRGMRFTQIIATLCAQQGINLPNDVGSREYMVAAFSGSSIGATVLGAVANKALADVLAEPNWLAPRVAGVASHGNFHTHTVYSMAVNGDLEVVPPTGEIEHMDLSAESWTRQLTTRAALLSVTRQDLINDELGAFTRNAIVLARKAMNGREKALFTAINVTGAGSTHFTAAQGNYISGTAFGHAELGNMIKAFRNLTGPDGDPVNVEPSILMVPSSHEEAARTLLASGSTLIATGLSATDSRAIEANANIYGGRFGGQPIVGPYLENSNLTGYSATATYLLADPNILPCFEIVYLNGQTAPVIEYFGLDAEINTLGVSWRVYYDVAAGAAEWRAGVKSAGA